MALPPTGARGARLSAAERGVRPPTVLGDADDPAWVDEERLLIQLVDELHDSAGISDEFWTARPAAFSVDQIFELIALVGLYHTVSFFANGLWLPLESDGAPFPERQPNTALNTDARQEPHAGRRDRSA